MGGYLGWRSPFPAIVSAYSPSFNVCTPPITFSEKVMPRGQSSPLVFYPGVDFGSEHDCDILPILMRGLMKTGTGVAVDVGASEGMCTLLLAASGHTVFSFEPEALFQEFRHMSVMANPGFSDRVHLKDGLDLETGTTLDSE